MVILLLCPFNLFLKNYSFICFWLQWGSVAALGLSLAVVSGLLGVWASHCGGFLLRLRDSRVWAQ